MDLVELRRQRFEGFGFIDGIDRPDGGQLAGAQKDVGERLDAGGFAELSGQHLEIALCEGFHALRHGVQRLSPENLHLAAGNALFDLLGEIDLGDGRRMRRTAMVGRPPQLHRVDGASDGGRRGPHPGGGENGNQSSRMHDIPPQIDVWRASLTRS